MSKKLVIIAFLAAACRLDPKNPNDKKTLEITAEATYEAQLLECVKKAKTVEESGRCRRDKDAYWAQKDGGR